MLCRTRKELITVQAALDKAGVPTILKVPEVIADAPYVKAVIALATFLKDNNDMAALALYAKSLGQDPFDETALKKSATAILDAFSACTTPSAISSLAHQIPSMSSYFASHVSVMDRRLLRNPSRLPDHPALQ